jgi:hypothetical protein
MTLQLLHSEFPNIGGKFVHSTDMFCDEYDTVGNSIVEFLVKVLQRE